MPEALTDKEPTQTPSYPVIVKMNFESKEQERDLASFLALVSISNLGYM